MGATDERFQAKVATTPPPWARRNALKKAVQILEESFSSPVPIVMEARFISIPTEGGGGTVLASAGPTYFSYGFPGVREANTWYSVSIVPRLAGTNACPSRY